MEFRQERHIGDILKERNIILKGADAATRGGFTQVPNFLLRSKKLSAGDKMTFAMLLSYAWPSYSTRYRKAKASKGLTGSFGDRSWPRKAII